MIGEPGERYKAMTGTVRQFEGSFGFIEPDDGSRDVFVHFTGIVDAGDGFRKLVAGQRVEFTIEVTAKGPQAFSVTVTEDAQQDAAAEA